jgi:hypothetical protein
MLQEEKEIQDKVDTTVATGTDETDETDGTETDNAGDIDPEQN